MKHNINFQCAIKKSLFMIRLYELHSRDVMTEVWEENVRWMELNIFTT